MGPRATIARVIDGGTSLESTARERAASVGLACGVDRPVAVEHALEEPRGLAGARRQAQGVPSPSRGAGRIQRNLHPYCAARLVSVVLSGLVLATCATRLPVVYDADLPKLPVSDRATGIGRHACGGRARASVVASTGR